MRTVALRGLMAHKLRLAATFLAIALGVAFVGGVLTLSNTMNRTFDELLASAYEATDAVVRSEETLGGGFDEEEQRGTVDASLLDRVQSVDTVASAEGSVEGYGQIIGRDGEPISGGMFSGPTIVGNWGDDTTAEAEAETATEDADDSGNPIALREGRAPRADDELVMDAGTARSHDYDIGDTVAVQTQLGVRDYELVGTVGFGTADTPAGQSMVLLTTDEAQRAIGEPGRFDAIYVVATDGTSQDEVVGDIRQVVGDGVEVLSGASITEQTQSDVKSSLSFVTNFFLAFAIVAVLVGSFVIYNAFSIIVAQRTREMALLRAIGASRAQVRRAVLIEAVAVGLIGSAIGFLLGLGLASALTGLLDIDGSLAVLPSAVVTAVLCGLLVTVLSALIPARRASKVAPIAALRDVAIDTTGRSRVRVVIGASVTALGVAGVVLGANRSALGLVGLGVLLTFTGLILAGPGVARPVSTVLGWPLARLRGVTGGLARQNVGRNPKRSAATAQALMIGIGIVAFFLVLNASMRASLDKLLDENFAGDLVVDSGNLGAVGLPTDVGEEVAALPEVEAVAPQRMVPARVDGDESDVVATNRVGFDIFGLDMVEGSNALGRGQVVVYEDTAESHGLHVGDPLDVDFLDAGATQLTVAGIYSASSDFANIGNYVVGLDELAAHVPNATDVLLTVELADGASQASAERAIEDVLGPYPTAEVNTADDFKEQMGQELDSILQIVMALLALTIIIALVGIANTVALSVLERTRELGLLRAVGMSRSQVRSSVRWESVIIALLGTVLGLAVGVLGGWGMTTAFRDEGFEVFEVPLGTLTVVVLVAGFLGMLAALVPAWRASRLDVLDAIATD